MTAAHPNGSSAALSPPDMVTAIAELFDHHGAELLRYLQLRTAAGDVAADLCAETFAAALESLHTYDSARGNPRQWMYGIARHKWADWARTEELQRNARERLGVTVDGTHVDDLDLVELRVDLAALTGPLHHALGQLSGPVRDAVRLRVVDELSYREVAQRLGCTEGAARVRVSRGLTELLDHLSAEHVTETP